MCARPSTKGGSTTMKGLGGPAQRTTCSCPRNGRDLPVVLSTTENENSPLGTTKPPSATVGLNTMFTVERTPPVVLPVRPEGIGFHPEGEVKLVTDSTPPSSGVPTASVR